MHYFFNEKAFIFDLNNTEARSLWGEVLCLTYLSFDISLHKSCLNVSQKSDLNQKQRIDCKSTLGQVMAWRRRGDKPVSKSRMTHLVY